MACLVLFPLSLSLRSAFFAVQARSICVCGIKGAKKPSFDRPLPPKKPQNAFLFFVKDKTPQLPSDLPQKEKLKALGAMWRGLDEKAKEEYVEKSNAAIVDYEMQLEEFMQSVDEDYVEAYTKYKNKRRHYLDAWRSKRKGEYVKRKLTAYSVFTSENFKEIYAKQPEVSDSMQKLANTSKELGARWKAMDQADKEAFQEKAEKINEERNKAQVDTKLNEVLKSAEGRKGER